MSREQISLGIPIHSLLVLLESLLVWYLSSNYFFIVDRPRASLIEKNISVEAREAYDNVKAVERAAELFKKQATFAQEKFTRVSKPFANGLVA